MMSDDELKSMSDGALKVAEQTLSNAVRRLEYVESLMPSEADDELKDKGTPAGTAAVAAHDSRELLKDVRAERRQRENKSLNDYLSGE